MEIGTVVMFSDGYRHSIDPDYYPEVRTTAFSSAIHEMRESPYRSKNEPNLGEGIVLKNIGIVRRRAKAHNRKKNRR